MGSIHIHHIEARLLGTQCGISMPAPELANIGLVHSSTLISVPREIWHTCHIHRDLPGVEVCRAGPAYPKLDTGKRAVTVHRLGHHGVVFDVVVVPQGCVWMG